MSSPLPLSWSQLGGMGFISVAECEVLRNNALINLHMAHTAAEMGVARCGAEEERSTGAEEQESGGESPLHPSTRAPQHPCPEGWEAKVSLKEGIARTYAWIEQQVKAAREMERGTATVA